MSESLPVVLSRDSELVRAARPITNGVRVLGKEALRDLTALEEEIAGLKEQAVERLAKAESEAEALEEEARQKGRQEGFEEWFEEITRARTEYARLQEQAEQDMVTLAFHIARRLVGHAIEVQPEVVRDIVGQALVAARGRRQIVVHVHPDDLPELEKARDEYSRNLDGVPVHFEADSTLDRGGCVIATESGRVDGRLQTRLEMLKEALTGP